MTLTADQFNTATPETLLKDSFVQNLSGETAMRVNLPSGTYAPNDATYVTTSANTTLSAEKVLTAGAGISIVVGANTVTITNTSSTGGGTLDYSYDFGSAGGGRTITVDSGALQLDVTTGQGLYVNKNLTGTLTSNTTDLVSFLSYRDHTGATTITDSYSTFDVKRESRNSNALGSFTARGTVLNLENHMSENSGVMNDLVNVLRIVQGVNTSGSALLIDHAGDGGAVDITIGNTCTSGSALGILALGTVNGYVINVQANALTTGSLAYLYSNSADTSARNLVYIANHHASAVNAIPLMIRQDGIVSTHFRKILAEENTACAIWVSDGTTPNGALTGQAGDICLNGDSGNIYKCTGTTNWTSM